SRSLHAFPTRRSSDLFFGDAVTIELNIKVFAELLMPPDESLFGLFFPDVQDEMRHLAAQPTGGGDQVLLVRGNQRLVNTGIDAIEPFGKTEGTAFGQMRIAVFVFGDQYLVISFVRIVLGELQLRTLFGDVELTADDSLDIVVCRFSDELEGAV